MEGNAVALCSGRAVIGSSLTPASWQLLEHGQGAVALMLGLSSLALGLDLLVSAAAGLSPLYHRLHRGCQPDAGSGG